MSKIIIEKRAEDYIAYLKENKGFWGNGRTPYEVIGNLIASHRKKFDIQLFESIKDFGINETCFM